MLKTLTHVPILFVKNKKIKSSLFCRAFKKSLVQNYLESCDCPFLTTALGNLLLKMHKRNMLVLRDLFLGESLDLGEEDEEEREELVFFCEEILSFIQKSNQELKGEVVSLKKELEALLFQ